MDNLYTVLGVDSKASPEEIKNAYRFLAMKFHPDKNPGNKEAEDRFKKINYAYSILINENKRKAYDEKNEGNDYQNQESAFSYEQAIYQFMNTMYAYAAEMTMKNIHSSKIAEFLISKGCPNGIAQTISISIENQRKTMVRKEAGWLFIKAIVSIFGGFVFTALTYGIASGIGGSRYVVFYGLVLYGIFNMFKALYYLVTGRVPQK